MPIKRINEETDTRRRVNYSRITTIDGPRNKIWISRTDIITAPKVFRIDRDISPTTFEPPPPIGSGVPLVSGFWFWFPRLELARIAAGYDTLESTPGCRRARKCLIDNLEID
ncbi:uncharacterized protein LOC122397395 [Colletes gigas]|uniref:uncharacterized protein LOC122397395 n=1 Tax=Colletes gigas TaxID=935657 RepID=UPI001C9AAD8F|nr:uncharacterized protein LOC122397395 [Colletes gigas]